MSRLRNLQPETEKILLDMPFYFETPFDAKKAPKDLFYRKGLEKGLEKGKELMEERLYQAVVRQLLLAKLTVEEIAITFEIPISRVIRIRDELSKKAKA